MKIEAGKRYTTLGGLTTGAIENQSNPDHPFYDPTSGLSYTSYGLRHQQPCLEDLVAEFREEPTQKARAFGPAYEQRRYEIARGLLVAVAADHGSDRWKRLMAVCVQAADDLLAELEKQK